ncbi:hypothetical protein D3C71_79180 [compost metagenome]
MPKESQEKLPRFPHTVGRRDPKDKSLMPFYEYHTDNGFCQFKELLELIKTNPEARKELEPTGDTSMGKPLWLLPSHLFSYISDCDFTWLTACPEGSGEMVPSMDSQGARHLQKLGYQLELKPPKKRDHGSTLCVDLGDIALVI